jgi:uncharacterized delta-60 repeat protein
MKKLNLIRSIIFVSSLLLQLITMPFHSRGAVGGVDLSFDPGSGVNGRVTLLAPQQDGKMIIGGFFTTVQGLARPGLARLHADGSGDGSFAPGALPGGVASLKLQADGKLLVGNAAGLYRLNSDGSPDGTFSANLVMTDESDGVYSIAVQADGKVIIGGFFRVDGLFRTLARFHANGTRDTSFNAAADGVYALAVQPNGRVLLAGAFESVNGTTRHYIARLLANGSLDTSFNPGIGQYGYVRSMALQADGKVVIGGSFTAANGASRNGLARLNANGSADTSYDPGAALKLSPFSDFFGVLSLAVQGDGRLLVSGTFGVAGTNTTNIARFNTDGSLDGGFNAGAGTNSDVMAVAVRGDGRVWLGGEFSRVQGAIRNRVARLEATGSIDTSFDSGGGAISGQVSSIVTQPDGRVLISGPFSSVRGTRRIGIARLEANGNLDPTFDPYEGLSQYVNAVVLQADGKVLVGGEFSAFAGTLPRSVVRLNPNGSHDAGFNPNLAALDQINDCPPGYPSYEYIETSAILVRPNGKIILGGQFWTIVYPVFEGEDTLFLSRSFVAQFNADGTLDAAAAPMIGGSASTRVRALTLQTDGKLLVGGSLSVSGATYILARLNADLSLDASYHPLPGFGWVASIAVQPDGKAVIGGGFFSVHGTSRNHAARLQTNGDLDVSFHAGLGLDGGVLAVAVQPDGKVLIGSDTAFDGTDYHSISRRNPDGTVDASFHPGTGADGTVRAIALQPDGAVLIGGSFNTVNGVLRPRVARLIGDPQPPSFATWAAGFGLSGVDALADADPDDDGPANAAEYVLGGNPSQPSTAVRPTVSRAGGNMVFTFPRVDLSETPDAVVTVEASTDLLTWPTVFTIGATTATSSPGVTILENDTAADTITVALPLGTHSRLFARMRVTILL